MVPNEILLANSDSAWKVVSIVKDLDKALALLSTKHASRSSIFFFLIIGQISSTVPLVFF